MDALEMLISRRSIRKYKSKPVEEDKIEKCLEAARWAPSAQNKQPWEFIIVKDEKMRKKFAEIHPYGKFVSESPVVFIPLTNPEISTKFHECDTTLTIIHFMIEAHSLGLGTCWSSVIGSPSEVELKKLLEVPDHLNILALVALGYPDEIRTSQRKELAELVHFEKY